MLLKVNHKFAVMFRRATGHLVNFDVGIREEFTEFSRGSLKFWPPLDAMAQFTYHGGGGDRAVRRGSWAMPRFAASRIAVGVRVEGNDQLHSSESICLRSLIHLEQVWAENRFTADGPLILFYEKFSFANH